MERDKTTPKVWFTSDLHFRHIKILKFQKNRREALGFSEAEIDQSVVDKDQTYVDAMDKWLIDKWNKTIGKKDSVYILGDICFGNSEGAEKILQKLNGKKYLVFGNHDKACRNENLLKYFEWTGDMKTISFKHNVFPFIREGETLVVELSHYPMVAWNHRMDGAIHLHGHTHGGLDDYNEASEELRADVGLDARLGGKNELVDLETVYNFFTTKITKAGCSTFKEYTEKLADKQGFRG